MFIEEGKVILYIIKKTQRMSKSYLPLMVINALVKTLMPILAVIMPKYLIDEIMYKCRINIICLIVLSIIISNFLLGQLSAHLDTIVAIKSYEINNLFDSHISEKIMELPYEKIEDPNILNLKERAIFPIKNQGAINRVVSGTSRLFSMVLTVFSLLIIICEYNIAIIPALIIICAINIKVLNKSCEYQYEYYKNLVPIQREFTYFSNLACDFEFGKEVRLYKMKDLILSRIRHYDDKSLNMMGQAYKGVGKIEGWNGVINACQIGLAYIAAVITFIFYDMTIGGFTMFINAVNKLIASIDDILKTTIDMKQMAQYLKYYIEFDQILPACDKGTLNCQNESFEIIFDNVSFKYPNSDVYVLKNVSVDIKAGEKVSIVGMNGAGKTTFVKLLLMLYKPTEGAILVNGINIEKYDFQDYIKHVSVIFQDYKLFAASIIENIAFEAEAEVEKIKTILSELHIDLKKLPNGLDTEIFKIFDQNGIEMSGGEGQKVAIARSIYKAADLIILDEPTAALDPIAEKEVYTHFDNLTGNKTSIFISHRLSSCHLSDKILVFDNGRIVQRGSHKKLLEDKTGLYYKMFSTQAKNYKKENVR